MANLFYCGSTAQFEVFLNKKIDLVLIQVCYISINYYYLLICYILLLAQDQKEIKII